eukprot:scaffold668767_cov48-Prasinocladus_malaysianus.AAC.1
MAGLRVSSAQRHNQIATRLRVFLNRITRHRAVRATSARTKISISTPLADRSDPLKRSNYLGWISHLLSAYNTFSRKEFHCLPPHASSVACSTCLSRDARGERFRVQARDRRC